MKYISIREAAVKWGITLRRVQELCKSGKIAGAERFGRAWMIPVDAKKPIDGRSREAKAKNDGLPHIPMPRKTPLMVFTDVYNTPGTADEVIASFADKTEIAALLHSQFEYLRGNIDDIYDDVQYFLKAHSGFNAVVGAGLQLMRSAVWEGDINLWRKGRQHIYEAPCETENDRQELLCWLAVADSFIYDTNSYPDWFARGEFKLLRYDTLPTARVYYVKYLMISAYQLASGQITLRDVEGLGLMRTLPYILEPMIAQAKFERTVVPEIYLHLMAASVYKDLGDNERSVRHVDRAIELALPDGLLTMLVEYRMNLDTLLDDRLLLKDEESLRKVKLLHKRMISGFISLHNQLLEKNLASNLTVREREVAKLAAFGLSNTEIAKRMHIELSSVKSHLFSVMNKVGAGKRSEIGQYI